MRCNKCHRPMAGTTAYDGACACGGLIEATPRRGNCYVTCEALYHLLGGAGSGWTPATLRHEGDVHWFLRRERPMFNGIGGGWLVLDPTAQQFTETPPYHLARGRGFLTREPSKRAREMMERMLWQSA